MTLLTHENYYRLWSMRLPFVMAFTVSHACQSMEKDSTTLDHSTKPILVQASEVPSFEAIGRKKRFRFNVSDGCHCKATHCNDGITDTYIVKRYKFIKNKKKATVEVTHSRAQFELIARAIKDRKKEHELSSALQHVVFSPPRHTLPESEEPEFYTNT